MAHGTLVIAEQRRGELTPVSLELIGAACSIKDDVGGPLMVALVGASPEDHTDSLSVPGVDEVLLLPVAQDAFQPDIQVAATYHAIQERAPRVILMPHSVDGWGYGAALAVRAGTGFASDVNGLWIEQGAPVAQRGLYGERVQAELEFPAHEQVLLALRPNSFEAAEGSGSPTVTTLQAPEVQPRSRHEEFVEPPSEGGIDMTSAEFILSVGRGVGEEENVAEFEELAERVGATLGCSRPIADAGWLPKARQIGYSGNTAASCRLYLAMGISGSVQHLAGMKHVDTIIAVNSDPNASIFSVASHGVVGDMFEIGQELRNHF